MLMRNFLQLAITLRPCSSKLEATFGSLSRASVALMKRWQSRQRPWPGKKDSTFHHATFNNHWPKPGLSFGARSRKSSKKKRPVPEPEQFGLLQKQTKETKHLRPGLSFTCPRTKWFAEARLFSTFVSFCSNCIVPARERRGELFHRIPIRIEQVQVAHVQFANAGFDFRAI